MTLEEAEGAIRNGAMAAIICGCLALVIAVLAFVFDGEGEFADLRGPFAFVQVAVVFALAEGIRRRSRTAAVVMLLNTILSKIVLSIANGQSAGIWVGLVLSYFFARAVQGTYVYHRIRRQNDPDYRAAPSWAYWAGITGVVLLIGMISLGVLVEAGLIADNSVRFGDQVTMRELEVLRSQGILLPGEQIVLFYSAGLVSILEDGNVLTDRRALSYQTVDGQLEIASAEYSEIADVSLADPGGTFADAQIVVTTTAGDEFLLLVSTEEKGDQRFLAELEARRKAVAK